MQTGNDYQPEGNRTSHLDHSTTRINEKILVRNQNEMNMGSDRRNSASEAHFRSAQATPGKSMGPTLPRAMRVLVPVGRTNTLPIQRWTPVNRKLISLALISHLISSQFLMTALISSMRLLSAAPSGSDSMVGLSVSNTEKSFINMVEASPAPTPLRAASARSATSQRVPPMNGSMFGKRDLAARVETTSEATRYNDIITEAIENFMASNREGKCQHG